MEHENNLQDKINYWVEMINFLSKNLNKYKGNIKKLLKEEIKWQNYQQKKELEELN